MKINILDAGINYRSGHHYDYGLKLAQHLTQTGHDVHVFGYAGMDGKVAEEFSAVCGLTKLFQTYQYAVINSYDWYAGEFLQFQRETIAYAIDLQSVREADLWIWPTILPQQLNACAALGVKTPMVGCVYWDPGVEAKTIEAKLWRSALVAARGGKVPFTLASVESELRHRFMPIVANGRFAVLPQPVEGPPIAAPKTALKRIGFFGHQREDKGAKIVMPLIQQLITDGYAVTLQNSNREVRVPDVPGLDVLGYVDDIAVPIAECDLVVLPYYVEQYRARGSGVLMQCLALGIPVAAPFGTLPGRIVEQAQVGPLFTATWPEPIYRAIKSAEQSYAAIAANAFKVAHQFNKRNGVARFASALLAAVE